MCVEFGISRFLRSLSGFPLACCRLGNRPEAYGVVYEKHCQIMKEKTEDELDARPRFSATVVASIYIYIYICEHE